MEKEELENMGKFAKAKQKMTRMTKAKQQELFATKQKAKEENASRLDEKYQVSTRSSQVISTDSVPGHEEIDWREWRRKS